MPGEGPRAAVDVLAGVGVERDAARAVERDVRVTVPIGVAPGEMQPNAVAPLVLGFVP